MKKLIIFIFAVIMVMTMSACNRQILDVTWQYEWAIIKLPNDEVVEGRVESWKDYDSDQLQIKIDGVSYLVHAANAVMYSGTR